MTLAQAASLTRRMKEFSRDKDVIVAMEHSYDRGFRARTVGHRSVHGEWRPSPEEAWTDLLKRWEGWVA